MSETRALLRVREASQRARQKTPRLPSWNRVGVTERASNSIMIIYNYTYFHKVLLRLKSINFTRYQHITEKNLLIQALNGEEITDHSEIDWRWLSEDLYGRENYQGNVTYFDINGELESFIYQIVPREERVRILTYLRDNCRECLFNTFYDEGCIRAFETECARLISQEIEERKHDEFYGDYAEWPVPDLKEIARPREKKSEYSIMETAILNAVPNYSENNPLVTKDVLLCVAYEFIDYFRASVKTFNDNGRDNHYKPCMSYKEQADKIYNHLIRRSNRYLYWNRTPVYQVFFILGCLMGMPDHRRSWHEQKFAEGIGDYLEMTDHFKGSKEKIRKLINNMLTLSQYQLDFDMENVEEAMNAQTEQLRQEQEQLESERLPKPEEPKQEPKTEEQMSSFAELLQCPKEDQKRVLERLHELLDNKGGMQVALVLAAALFEYNYIITIPTEKQYRSEFNLCGTWRAVTSYINKHTTIDGEFTAKIDHIVI